MDKLLNFSAKQSLPNKKVLQEHYEANCIQYERVVNDLQQRIKLDLSKIDLVPTVKARVKSFDSYYKKVLSYLKQIKGQQKNIIIYDVLGLRIICPFLDDLKAVEKLIKEKYIVVEMEHKGTDYSFKEFGYEAIHILIEVPKDILSRFQLAQSLVCEIQLCTILQDAWGEVEHELVYKANFSPFDESLKRKLAALNATLTLSDTLFQEIRDYQRLLQAELKKRREAFIEQLHNTIDSTIFGLLKESAFKETAVKEINRNTKDVREVFEKNINDNIDNLLLRALEAHNSKEYRKAIAIYTLILDLKTDHYIKSIIHIHRGMAYFSESHYEDALADFSKSIKLHPENWRAFYYRGVTHQINQDYTEALNDLNQCLQLDPYQFDSLFNRSRVYFHLGDYPKAFADCEQALNIEPESFQAQKLKDLIKAYIKL